MRNFTNGAKEQAWRLRDDSGPVEGNPIAASADAGWSNAIGPAAIAPILALNPQQQTASSPSDVTPVQAWVKIEYSFEIYDAPGGRDDGNSEQYVQEHATLTGPYSVGATFYDENNNLPYFGVANKGYWINQPSFGSSETFVQTSTQYMELREIVTDIVTDPHFTPASISGGEVASTLRNDNSGISGMDFTGTFIQYQWVRTDAIINDRNGDGYDDAGETATGHPFTTDDLAALLQVPVVPSASTDLLTISDFFAESANDLAKDAKRAQLVKWFDPLGNLMGSAGTVADIDSAVSTTYHSTDPDRTGFIEGVNLFTKSAIALGGYGLGALVTAFELPAVVLIGAAVVSVVYTFGYEDAFKSWLGTYWDSHYGVNAPSTAPAPPPAILFDPDYYLQTYSDAAQALLNGTASSAFAYYLAVGLAAGEHPNATDGAVDPASVDMQLIDNDPAAGSHFDVRYRAFGTYAGDGANASELGFVRLLNDGRAAAGLTTSASLFALANRLAVDLATNYSAAPQAKAAAGSLAPVMSFSDGESASALFPNLDLSHVSMYVLANDGSASRSALEKFLAGSATASDFHTANSQTIGVAEYGGVWVVLVDHQQTAGGHARSETVFQLVHYGSSSDDYLVAGDRAARLEGLDGNDTLVGGKLNDVLNGGDGNDILKGSVGDDVLDGGLGKDRLSGGAGADHFVYASAAESSGIKYDIISGFDAAADKIDLNVAVAGVGAAITAGALSTATFDADLAKAANNTTLAAGHAVTFAPTSGNLAGHQFLIVDANGVAGYQAGADYVFQIDHAAHLASLGGAFI